MRVEVDQSIKIEQMSRDTIIGLSNDIQYVVVLPSRVKRKLQEDFRLIGRPKLFRYRVFMAGVVLLLRYAGVGDKLSIRLDREYAGKERAFVSMFLEMWSRGDGVVPPFEISEIGKSSSAHNVCFQVLRGKRKANRVLTYGEIKRLSLP
ncbi:MAG: hypothetical protein ABIH36_01400 [bacterium]